MSTSVASQLAILSNVSVLLYYEITQQLTVENFDQPNKMANVEGTTTYIFYSYYTHTLLFLYSIHTKN